MVIYIIFMFINIMDYIKSYKKNSPFAWLKMLSVFDDVPTEQTLLSSPVAQIVEHGTSKAKLYGFGF